ncbi:MAG: hypothetical protein FWJ92_04240 [Actinomycetes bacterium]|nr:hypothetical protein [Acidimicrobiia bacterium]
MDQHPDPRRLERGFASLQFVLAAALAMLMVVGLVQLVAYQYTRGAVLAALERGARAGSVAGAGATECVAVVADALASVVGGLASSVEFGCSEEGGAIVASARGSVPGWISSATDLSFSLETWAWREDP